MLTTKETLGAEIADADALIVRSATKVTPELLDQAGRLRVVVDQVATLTDTSAVTWHARLCH